MLELVQGDAPRSGGGGGRRIRTVMGPKPGATGKDVKVVDP